MQSIKTPETDPDHHTVGRHLAGYSWESKRTEIYFCDSYDPSCGYWLTNVNAPEDRKNVSERAIGATYHKVEDQGESWWVNTWSVRKRKEDLTRPHPEARCRMVSEHKDGKADLLLMELYRGDLREGCTDLPYEEIEMEHFRGSREPFHLAQKIVFKDLNGWSKVLKDVRPPTANLEEEAV
jgi:hypothetical protein